MKSIETVLFENLHNKEETVNVIDIPHFCNMKEILKGMIKVLTDKYPNIKVKPKDISVIATTHIGYNLAKDFGCTVTYLYDNLDFTDRDYYVIQQFPVKRYTILESADGLSGELVQKVIDSLNARNYYFYILNDCFTLRRYTSLKDTLLERKFNDDIISKNMSYHNPYLQAVVNKLRLRRLSLESILKDSQEYPKQMEYKNISEFSYTDDLDVSKPIITPHITVVREMNIKIREYLGIADPDDVYKPQVNEWLVSHGPAIAYIRNKQIVLPIGYRLKVKGVAINNMEDSTTYDVFFDYTYPDGKVKEARVTISRSYIQFLVDGSTILPHNPNSYNFYFGYVVGDFYFVHNRVSEAIVFYDYTLSSDRRDLYTSLIPIVDYCRILYSLDKRIKY